MYKKSIIGVMLFALAIVPGAYAFADNDHEDVHTTSATSLEIQDIDNQIKNLKDQIEMLQKKRAELLASSGNTKKEEKNNSKKYCREFRSQLRQGMKDDDVIALQEYLAEDSSLYPEGLVTGFFGPATRAALIRFQLKNGVEGVGELGPQTRALLMMKIKTRCGTVVLPSVPITFPTSTQATSTSGLFKITLCHKPGTIDQQTLDVPISAYFGHLQHGDKIGSCTTTPPTPTDTTPPVLSELSAQNIGGAGATIHWLSNEAATSKVWYATTTNLTGAPMVENTSLVTTHDVVLSGLTASTTYYYMIESKDAAGNTSTSSQTSFSTTN